MINIDIDLNRRNVKLTEFKKNKTIVNDFGNISVNGADGVLVSIKLMIFAVTKIFIYHKDYSDKEFIFHINDAQIINLIKNETCDIYEKINPEWHNEFDNKTLSELGRLLSMLKKLPSKDILYIKPNEIFNNTEHMLIHERAKLVQEQSSCDKKLQDILHDIEYGYCEYPEKTIKNIENNRLKRRKIKEDIKAIDNKLHSLSKKV